MISDIDLSAEALEAVSLHALERHSVDRRLWLALGANPDDLPSVELFIVQETTVQRKLPKGKLELQGRVRFPDDTEWERLKADWLSYIADGTPRGGAYKGEALVPDGMTHEWKPREFLWRFDDLSLGF